MANKPADRSPREQEDREQEVRATEVRDFAPPELLPEPNPRPGWEHKWVRTQMQNTGDVMNVSKKLRIGYEPCTYEDYPEMKLLMSDIDGRFAKEGNIEVGGLMLCKIPSEIVEKRKAYYAKMARDHQASVDRTYRRQSDSRMPLETFDNKTTGQTGE